MKCFLGVDIGSVSTKFVLIDQKGEVLYSTYFRTEGDPIGSLKKGLRWLEEFIKSQGKDIEISGLATTGSGRYLASAVLGADIIKNEITAHAKGVTRFMPETRTVIEIGGQDSKIIILENGAAVDFAMNLLCLKGDAKITTNPSYNPTPIREIRIGKRVLTHQGRFMPVEQVYERRYKGQMIDIEVFNVGKLETTPEHPVWGLKRNDVAVYKLAEQQNCKKQHTKQRDFSWEPKPIPARDLREGDFVIIPLSGFKKRFCDFISQEKKQDYRFFIYKNWLFAPIRRIRRYQFEGSVYNLRVKGDSSYVANFVGVHNCAAGTGAFLDAQAFRLGIPVEKFGEFALRSKNPTVISSRCTVFAESDMIHKQQVGHKVEDIIAGLCQGMARNYLAGVARGKKINPPIVFLGGVSENVGMRWAFKEELKQEIIVPKYNKVMGALGAALLVRESPPQKTRFRGFAVSEKEIRTSSFICQGCPNHCEVIEARIEGKVVARWGDRCGRWSNLKY